MRLIKISDKEALKAAGVPFSRTTLQIYHSQGKYAEIFVKVGNFLCIDVDAWQTVLETAKSKALARAQKLKSLRGNA